VAVHDTAINRMDVRFRVYRPGEAQGALAVRLWQQGRRPRLVMDTRLDSAQLQDRASVTLYFAPERDAPGHIYTWEIASAGGTAQSGVGLCTLVGGSPSVSMFGADWSQVFEGKVYIHERSAPYPRATVVYAAKVIPDDVQAVRRLLDDSFDLRNVAVVADPVDLPAEAGLPAGRAEITHYADDQVAIKASAAQPGLLVLGDQYHPGWRAFVDGRPAKIVRANHIFRGVILPPGDHEVLFRFAPASLRIGGLLSGLGIALIIVLAASALRSRRLARLRIAGPADDLP
jgi:hypothetical protein